MSYLTHVSEHDTLVPQFTKGDRLAKARKTAGIGQQEMAQLLLRDRKTIGNWENDHTEPTPRVLQRWAELTNVPLWWLTDGDRAEDEPASNDRRGSGGGPSTAPLPIWEVACSGLSAGHLVLVKDVA